MKNMRHMSREHGVAIVVAVSYAVIALFLVPHYAYLLQNDTTSYLSIAAKYVRGDIAGAINAYWGPMYSWLIAVLMGVGIDPLVAVRLINIAAGLGVIVIVESFRTMLNLRTDVRKTVLVTSAILVLMYALDMATPDLLLTLLLLGYVRITLRPNSMKPTSAVAAGVIAGVAYLTKSVALPFFLVHWTGLCIARGLNNRSMIRSVLMSYVLGIAACLVIAAPWIYAISRKHGAPTFGESAHFIHATMNPLKENEVPMNVRGLLPPPNETAVSVWEDPTTMEYADWSPLSSRSAMIDQVRIIVLNLVHLGRALVSSVWLLWAVFMAAIVFALRPSFGSGLTRLSREYLWVWILLLGAYSPIIADERYVWLGIVLAILVGGGALSVVFERTARNRVIRMCLLAIFAASFLLYPAWKFVDHRSDGKAAFVSAVETGNLYKLAGARTASDNWKIGLRFSYATGTRFYGRPIAVDDDAALEKELLASDIDVYIALGRTPKFRSYEAIQGTDRTMKLFQRVKLR